MCRARASNAAHVAEITRLDLTCCINIESGTRVTSCCCFRGFCLQVLVKEGKVKYIGLSECPPADVRRAHAVHPITVLEMEWSLFSRDAEVCPYATPVTELTTRLVLLQAGVSARCAIGGHSHVSATICPFLKQDLGAYLWLICALWLIGIVCM